MDQSSQEASLSGCPVARLPGCPVEASGVASAAVSVTGEPGNRATGEPGSPGFQTRAARHVPFDSSTSLRFEMSNMRIDPVSRDVSRIDPFATFTAYSAGGAGVD